ncbi:unnamed protein product [Orchesella dallaii]|uniref:Peptidase S1 domain-containing protein n=1 Tax=Orchesella dallaii TaxID=48710 RepID=A0ABP1RFG4_9HEXA
MACFDCIQYSSNPFVSSPVLTFLIVSLSQATTTTTVENVNKIEINQSSDQALPIAKADVCECGSKSEQDVKIVGGTLSKEHAWPWVAAIVNNSSPGVFCGASVITNKYLLTAAHCTMPMKQQGLSHFTVILGTNNLDDNTAVQMKVASVTSHPRYNAKTYANDIALLELGSPLNFTKYILPICLTPQIGVPYANKSAIVAGWGDTSFNGQASTLQRQIMIDVLTNKECQLRYVKDYEITNTMMCARKPGKDSCQGDSGGPLFRLKKGSTESYLQIGIVSFGTGCADPKYPGVYTRLSRFTKWVRNVLGNEDFCGR